MKTGVEPKKKELPLTLPFWLWITMTTPAPLCKSQKISGLICRVALESMLAKGKISSMVK